MKYLTFMLADHWCGIELAAVRELLGYMPFSPLIGEHPATVGLFDLRGRLTRVLDLRIRFGLPVTRTDDTVMLLVECAGETTAMIVDSCVGLETLATVDAILPVGIDPRFLIGSTRIHDRTLTLLDTARVIVVPPPLPKAA